MSDNNDNVIKGDFKSAFTESPETPIVQPEMEVKKDKKNNLIIAMNFLLENYEFRYNEMTTKFEYKSKSDTNFKFLDNMDYENIRMEMKFNNIFVSENDYRGLLNSNRVITKINPIKEYLFSLPAWDTKTDYIAKILDNLIFIDESKRDEYIEYFKRWFVAMVCGLVDDSIRIEAINHTCLVLVAEQGLGKTKFFTDLLPEQFRSEYIYSGNFQMENKDHTIMLATKLIINLDELAALNKSDLEMVKSRMTQTHISIRKAYDKVELNLKRRASFCGSSNNIEVLRDVTGSRRFLMLSVKTINNDKPADIKMAWSQALSLYKSGFKYWFSGDDIKTVEENNTFYTSTTIEEDLIVRHFAIPDSPEKIKYMTTTDIAMKFGSFYTKYNINASVTRAIGTILSKLGYKKVHKRINGKATWVWEVYFRGFEDEPKVNELNAESRPEPLPERVQPVPF